MSYVDLFTRYFDKPEGTESTIKATEIFKDCGSGGWVGKYEKELLALS